MGVSSISVGVNLIVGTLWVNLESLVVQSYTKRLVSGLGLSATEPDQALQFIPDERGSDEEKEPERVPVEPETPDVAAPAKQPHNTTVPVDPRDVSRHRRLAVAVILQAIEDGATEWFFSSYSRQSVDFCAVWQR